MSKVVRLEVVAPDLRVEVELPVQSGQTLLGHLIEIQQTVDGRLGLRSNCGTGQCGICAVRVAGRPTLACRLPVRGGETYVVEPLSRDSHLQGLVCDISGPTAEFFLRSGEQEELEDKQAFESLLCRPSAPVSD